MALREGERDVAAHREAEDVRRSRPQLLDHGQGVVGEHLDRVLLVGLVRASRAAVVEGDHAEAARESAGVCRSQPHVA